MTTTTLSALAVGHTSLLKATVHLEKATQVCPAFPAYGSAHRASLQFCLDIYGLREVYGGNFPRRPRNASAPQFNTACSTALRDPYERAVSGWFYRRALPQRDAHLVRRVVQRYRRSGVVRPHLRARAARHAGAVPMTTRRLGE